jgi:hypothetical protein
MARRHWHVILGVVLLCFAACDDSPTGPRPPTDLTGVPQFFSLRYWTADVETKTLSVQAWGRWGIIYTASREVTAETIWSSSDPSVARIIGQGQIQSVSPGEVTLTGTFAGLTVTQALRVFSGDAPTRVLSSAIGYISDSSKPCCQNRLAGATIEILSGYNAGRSAVTTASGDFTFTGPFYCGESMIRLTKPGYREVVRPLFWCSEVPQPHLEMSPVGG